MHHSDKPFDDAEPKSAFEPTFGATGKFPDGKLVPHDEGEIRFGVTHKGGKVIIDFGEPVHWIGMTPDQAKLLAASLITRSGKATEGYVGLTGYTESHPEV